MPSNMPVHTPTCSICIIIYNVKCFLLFKEDYFLMPTKRLISSKPVSSELIDSSSNSDFGSR